jgi:6-phosphogluconolactonase
MNIIAISCICRRRGAAARPTRFATLALALVALVVTARAEFAYVVNQLSNNVSAYRIGENGALTPVPGSPFPTGTLPLSVAVDPLGKFVYVANGGSSNNISAYRIGENGALTPVPPGRPFFRVANPWR